TSGSCWLYERSPSRMAAANSRSRVEKWRNTVRRLTSAAAATSSTVADRPRRASTSRAAPVMRVRATSRCSSASDRTSDIARDIARLVTHQCHNVPCVCHAAGGAARRGPMALELWTTGIAHANHAPRAAARAEAAGWDGMVVVDSQNLSGDTFVALALAARETTKLRLGTGVTNPATRHPAACAAG